MDLLTSVAPDQVVVGELASLQRLVANLLSNAVKYTRTGGRVTLTLAPEESEGRPGVRLTCADDGIGISDADLDRVFTPFFRSGNPEARERPGTGLGLSIVERVVTWHGGTIAVTSELGVGTTFVVWLPARCPTTPSTTSARPAHATRARPVPETTVPPQGRARPAEKLPRLHPPAYDPRTRRTRPPWTRGDQGSAGRAT